MPELPSGTLTMLFSDIEGSTLTLSRLGKRWGEALSAQRAILREVFATHGGHEMGTEGDSFFVVFISAHQAVTAALEGQRRLQSYDWPDGVPIRVRMGLHSGEPARHEDGYIGLDVHRAARIAGTAGGGQVVLSEATRLLSGLGDDPSVSARDLGWHRLKDLAEPEHLYDLVADGLLSDFAPLRSIGTLTSLPAAPTPLVGRGGELAALRAAILEPDVRLLTLTGPGGSGKTRLAVGVASALGGEFPAGVFFVDLHTAQQTVTTWLGIADALDVGGDTDEPPRDRVRRFLANRAALLILDNLEQIPQADEVVSHLLDEAPKVRILATSRRPLHLVREYEHPVPPLELPDRGTLAPLDAVGSGAVELFVRRARMVRPAFELTEDNVSAVIELCHRLDGLPLAIELAAARSKLLTPQALLGRIDTILGAGVSAADRTERQRTLAATIAWSYDLLAAPEQRAFCRLGVFAGSCDLAAIEAVVVEEGGDPLDPVALLADVSLVQIVDGPDGEPRVTMLETIRAFARERLEADDADHVRRLHAQWCIDRAQAVDELLLGASQLQGLDQLSLVEDDIRNALQWCLAQPSQEDHERAGLGLQLVTAMATYWYRFGYAAEGRAWFGRALDVAEQVDSLDIVNAVHGMAVLQLQQGEVRPATEGFERAVEMARRLGEREHESRELNSLAIACRIAGNPQQALRLGRMSVEIAREVGSARRECTALSNLLVYLMDLRDWTAAAAAGREAIAGSRRLGDDWAVVVDESNLTMALLRTEGHQAAFRHLAPIIPRARALADPELDIDIVELLSVILSGLDQVELSGELMAVADTQRLEAALPRAQPDQQLLEEGLSLANARDHPRWPVGYEAGRLLSVDEVVARALAVRVDPTVAATDESVRLA